MRVTAPGRVRRSEAEWRAIFEQCQQSGLEPVAFCEREGIVWSSFQKWQRRLAGPPLGRFVELAPRQAAGAQGEVEVSLPSGVVIRVRG